jgi:hypothetical protein
MMKEIILIFALVSCALCGPRYRRDSPEVNVSNSNSSEKSHGVDLDSRFGGRHQGGEFLKMIRLNSFKNIFY